MKQVKETLWSKLSDATGNILEFVDITHNNLELTIGEEFETYYSKNMVTEKVAEEILWYQTTEENESYYTAKREGNKVYIKFLKNCL